MNVLDGILGQISENTTIRGLADKFGLTPEQVASAVTALGQAHGQPGDTVQDAADATGLSPDMLGENRGLYRRRTVASSVRFAAGR